MAALIVALSAHQCYLIKINSFYYDIKAHITIRFPQKQNKYETVCVHLLVCVHVCVSVKGYYFKEFSHRV